jgi:general secretion pathway protein F
MGDGVESVSPEGGRLFRYRAVEAATGRHHAGERRGASAYEVRASLRGIGLQVDQIEEIGGAPTISGWRSVIRRTLQARACRRHRSAKADLCDGLATLLQAGVPLEQAVSTLAATGSRPPAERRLLETIRDRLRAGISFAAAITEHPDWFERFDVALLEAGQQAGDLVATLLSLSQYHQRAGALSQKILVALAYPAVLVIAGIGAVEFMSFQTLPPLVDMIVQARREPPALTLAVMSLGQGLAIWWPVVIAVIVVAVIGIRRAIARLPVDSRVGRWVHGNVLARLRSRVRVAHLAMSLARLRRAGMPLADALVVVSDTIEDRALRHLLTEAVTALRNGQDLSAVLAPSPLLDPEFAQLLHLGERSGELTEMLERIAERYQRAADRVGERLGAVLSPLAIIILACLIGVVVMASVLPLMQLGDLV